MPDSSSSIERNQNLPDSVWQIGSEEGQIEPASIDVEGLTPETFEELVDGFKTVAHAARRHIGDEENRTQLLSYWIDGRMIVEYEQDGKDRAEYGAQTLKKLSARLKAELGRGFWFIGTQQRITIGNVHYHVDMVFYNKLLRSYVLIELKTTPLLPAAVGQVNAYLNYYAEEVNDEFDNPPIGIILCTDKRNIDAHYALGGLENRVFASTYTTIMPDEEQLAEQVRMAIEANERKALMSGEEDA